MSPKIAIIIERADISLGGAERSVFELIAALRGLSLDVDLIAATGQTDDILSKHFHILFPGPVDQRTDFHKFRKTLKQFLYTHKYDLVHSVLPLDFADIYQPRGGSYAEAALQNANSYPNAFTRAMKKATIFANRSRAVFIKAEKQLCLDPNGPTIAALSEYVAESFIRHYGIPQDRVKIIKNGVKTDKNVDKKNAQNIRASLLKKFQCTESLNPIIFFFAAHNFRLKGLTSLIKAFAIANQQNTQNPFFLVVAGRGKQSKYKHLAKKLGVSEKIDFAGSLRNIQNLASITDVAILPTYYDPSSRFILESVAAAKPAITTHFNGACDFLTNGRHGIVIESPEDIKGLASAIIYFTDKNNIKTCSNAIIEDNLEKEISISRVALQLKELYTQLLEKKEQK